jgi:hypothetical protein
MNRNAPPVPRHAQRVESTRTNSEKFTASGGGRSRDAEEGGQGGGDVVDADALGADALWDAGAEPEHGHVGVVVVGRAVRGAGGACEEVVGLENEEEIAAAVGVVTAAGHREDAVALGRRGEEFVARVSLGDYGQREERFFQNDRGVVRGDFFSG